MGYLKEEYNHSFIGKLEVYPVNNDGVVSANKRLLLFTYLNLINQLRKQQQYYQFNRIACKRNLANMLFMHYGIHNTGIFFKSRTAPDFYEIYVTNVVFDVVSEYVIVFFEKWKLRKLQPFKVIYFLSNTEENEFSLFFDVLPFLCY